MLVFKADFICFFMPMFVLRCERCVQKANCPTDSTLVFRPRDNVMFYFFDCSWWLFLLCQIGSIESHIKSYWICSMLLHITNTKSINKNKATIKYSRKAIPSRSIACCAAVKQPTPIWIHCDDGTNKNELAVKVIFDVLDKNELRN